MNQRRGTVVDAAFVGRRGLGLYWSPRFVLCELDVIAVMHGVEYLREQPAYTHVTRYVSHGHTDT